MYTYSYRLLNLSQVRLRRPLRNSLCFYTGVSSAADWMGKTYEDHPSLFVHRSVYNGGVDFAELNFIKNNTA